jgi:hypothetical protein
MSVGDISFREITGQPDHLRASQGMTELAIRFTFAESGVPIGIEHAGFGRQDRPLTIDMDGATFKTERGLIIRIAKVLTQPPGELRILLVSVEFHSPRVEVPGRGRGRSVSRSEEGRARIPRPGIIDSQREDLDGGAAMSSRLGNGLLRRDHRYRLEGSDRPGHPGIRRLGFRQSLSPQLRAAGPGHPATRVGGPFGRHAEPRFERCLVSYEHDGTETR